MVLGLGSDVISALSTSQCQNQCVVVASVDLQNLGIRLLVRRQRGQLAISHNHGYATGKSAIIRVLFGQFGCQ